jgi:hypothetical protein
VKCGAGLRSSDFFDTDHHPEMRFRQTGDSLEIDVSTMLDQRRLGITWSPLAMTRSPVTLKVHATLRPSS